MANGTMEAKRNKMRRAKRTFPKSYCSNYIPVGMPPNRLVMGEYKERARGLAFDAEYLAFLEKTARFKGKTPARLVAETRAALERIETIAPNKMCFKLIENSALRARCFFNSERTLWVIMEENFKEGQIKTSMTYASKDSIVYAWKKDKLKWVTITHKRISREVPAPPLSTG